MQKKISAFGPLHEILFANTAPVQSKCQAKASRLRHSSASWPGRTKHPIADPDTRTKLLMKLSELHYYGTVGYSVALTRCLAAFAASQYVPNEKPYPSSVFSYLANLHR